MDEYLTAESRFTEDKISYADDLATIVQRNCGLELERWMVGAMSDLTAGDTCHKLTISASKTVCMFVTPA
jgi:hypothetical protein